MHESTTGNNLNRHTGIAIVGPYPPLIGGTASFLSRLVPALADAGVRCHVFNTMAGDPGGGISARIKRLWFFLGLACRVAWARQGIIHCHAVNWANLLGHGIVLMAARLTGKKSILTLHAGDLLAKFEADRPSRIVRWLLRLPQVITTVTPDLARAVQRLTGKNALFIANELTFAQESRDVNEQDIPAYVREFSDRHEPVIVLVGAMDRIHGIDVLLRALTILRSGFPKLGAIIIAYKSVNVEYQREIQALIEREDLRDTVLVPDLLPSVAAVLALADVFVRPTLSDGDSIAVREAISARVPVVASHVGYRPEGVALCPPGDHEELAASISRVLSSPEPAPLPREVAPNKTVEEYLRAYEMAAA